MIEPLRCFIIGRITAFVKLKTDFKLISILAAGAVVGLLSFSKVLKWLFAHYKNATLAVLTGFILGSLNKIWPWKEIIESEMINIMEIFGLKRKYKCH